MARVERQKYPGLERLQAALHQTDTQERLGEAGVRTALIVNRDGLMIDAVVYRGEAPDVEDLAAHAAAVLHFASSRSDGTPRTRINVVAVEYEDGTIAMEPTGESAILVFLSEPLADATRIRGELHRLATSQAGAADDAVATSTQEDAEPTVKRHTAAHDSDEPLKALNWLHADPVVSSGNGHGVPASDGAHPAERGADRAEPSGVLAGEAPMSQAAGSEKRVVLKGVGFVVTGQSATATVGLVLDGRSATGRAVSRVGVDTQHRLPAEAATRAVSEFLPASYGVVLEQVQVISGEIGQEALWARVLFLAPGGEEMLLGVAEIGSDAPGAAVRAVLSAVNRRIGLALDQA